MNRHLFFVSFMLLSVFAGCKNVSRGATTEEPPIHLQRNMFTQDKGKPLRENRFFADGRVMRPIVSGTVSTDAPDDFSDPLLTGISTSSNAKEGPVSGTEEPNFVAKVPLPITMDLIKRGQERYGIYCAPCHGESGYGNGPIVSQAQKNGFSWAVSSYHEDRLRQAQTPDGRIFDVITHGIRTMPSYASQIPGFDRWAIVAYIRALQRSQQTNISEISIEERSLIK